MDKTVKTRIFSDTTLAINDSNQLSPVSDQVLDKSDVQIRKKRPKTLFFSENGQILDRKGSKIAPIFLSEQKFSLTIFKQLTYSKNLQKIINGLEENGQKQPKTI